MEYTKTITSKFGGRLTGSTAYQKAAEWAVAEFRAMGIKEVKLEPFTFPNGWERGWATAQMLSPIKRPLNLQSMGWTPATPANGIKGDIIYIGDISPEKLRSQADKLRNKIVMINLGEVYRNGFFEGYGQLAVAYPIFKELGVAAVLLPDREPGNLINARGALFQGEITPLPVAAVSFEDQKLILEHLENREIVTIEFKYENHLSGGPIQVNNVIAEIRGREKPDEWVIVGAHLDSWDFATGAQDNATGCAMVLDAARAIMSLGVTPRRSIRFALWTGEEQGLMGSTAYVNAHANELDKCIAVLNTDNGAGHPNGWKVEDRQDLLEAMRPISRTLTAFSGNGLSSSFTYDTDHGPFFLKGVPALDLWVDMKGYGEVHHKSNDTDDKVEPHNLIAGTAIVTLTTFQIADRPEPIAPRLKHDEVEKILQKQGYDKYLKARGLF